MNFRNKGMTLLEMIFVLLVVLAVVFVSTRYYIMGRTSARIAQVMSQIDSMLEASHTWYLGNSGTFCGTNSSPSTSGVNCQPYTNCNDPICTQKLLDSGLINQKQVLNPFPNKQGDKGKYMLVNPSKADSNILELSLYLPPQACEALLQKYKNKTLQDSHCEKAGEDEQDDAKLYLYFE